MHPIAGHGKTNERVSVAGWVHSAPYCAHVDGEKSEQRASVDGVGLHSGDVHVSRARRIVSHEGQQLKG